MATFNGDIDISCLQEDCNTTWINTGNLPSITFVKSLPVLERSLVITAIVVALLSNCLYVLQIALLIRKKCSYNYIKLASTLLALYPVYETMSCIAMIIPRANQFMSILIGAYTMIVFNDFSNMISYVFGGFKRLLEKMDGQEVQMPRVCRCLPKILWTKKRVIFTRALVRQGKLVYYNFVVLSAILLLNGNYEKRPLEFDRPLFWFSAFAGLSRFVATISIVIFVRSVIRVLTGYSLGKKFLALQIINLLHLITGFFITFIKSRRIPLRPYGLVTVENRIDLYGNFALIMVTTTCQLWAFILFQHSPKPMVTPQSPRRGPSIQQRRTSSSYTIDTVQSSVSVVDDSIRQVASGDELANAHMETMEESEQQQQQERQVNRAV